MLLFLRQRRIIFYSLSAFAWLWLVALYLKYLDTGPKGLQHAATKPAQRSDLGYLGRHFKVEETEARKRTKAVYLDNELSLSKTGAIGIAKETGLDGNAREKGSAGGDAWRTPESVFAERRRRVLDICANDPGANYGRVKDIYTHRSSGVIYCTAVKAGCTFWKRVFYVVNKENYEVGDFFNISRNVIHSLPRVEVPLDEDNHDWRHFPMRFSVARDPFSRLLSSYLDKAYLPNFWHIEMLPMVIHQKLDDAASPNGDFLRSHFDNMAARFDHSFKASSTAGDRRCGKYVTFAEFIKGGFKRDEPHWMPLSQICNPCKFNVTHLSYMETFAQDARSVLGHMGMAGLMDNQDKESEVNEELQTMVDYFFQMREEIAHIENCASTKEIAYRLWNNFRWRGYIDPEVEYVPPPEDDSKKVKEDLKRQLAAARVLGMKNEANMKAAKKDFYRKIYSTLSREMFEKLLEKFKMDVKLYGYEKKRDELRSLYAKANE